MNAKRKSIKNENGLDSACVKYVFYSRVNVRASAFLACDCHCVLQIELVKTKKRERRSAMEYMFGTFEYPILHFKLQNFQSCFFGVFFSNFETVVTTAKRIENE